MPTQAQLEQEERDMALVRQLQHEEEQVQSQHPLNTSKQAAAATTGGGYTVWSRGRGSGGRGNCRGGRAQELGQLGRKPKPAKQNRDAATNENYAVVGSQGSTKCYLCGLEGHLATKCPKGQANQSEAKITPVEGGGQIVDVEGDLMTAPDSLCHCVSQCLAMGKGIAVLFKQKFGGVDELKSQKVAVPGVAVLHRPTDADPSKYCYYLITKPRYFDKPTYDTLAASLEAMFAHMEVNGVKSVSMPEIGCGLDGLVWGKVHDMLCALSVGRGITITVYHFKPANQMWSKKGKYA